MLVSAAKKGKATRRGVYQVRLDLPRDNGGRRQVAWTGGTHAVLLNALRPDVTLFRRVREIQLTRDAGALKLPFVLLGSICNEQDESYVCPRKNETDGWIDVPAAAARGRSTTGTHTSGVREKGRERAPNLRSVKSKEYVEAAI